MSAPLRVKLPSYRHHKPSGQAVVTLTGRDVYLGPHGTRLSRDNYDRVVGEWLAGGRAAPRTESSPPVTVADLVNAFRKSGEIPASHEHTYKAVMSILVRLYRRTPVNEFGPVALKVVRETMVESDWNRRTVNNRVHMVRRIFKWGVERQWVEAGVLQALKALPGLRYGRTAAPEPVPVQPVAQDRVLAILPALTPMVAAMVELQRLTGMRAGELCLMRGIDIDTTDSVWVYRPESHKTRHHGKSREIPLGPRAIELLRPWLTPDLSAYLFSPAESEKARRAAISARRRTPMSCGNRPGTNRVAAPKRSAGDRYTTVTYRRAIYRACDRTWPLPENLKRARGESDADWMGRLTEAQKAEIDTWKSSHRWHPHQLRHDFGTRVINQFSAEHAQRSLGHSNLQVTQIYAKLALEKAKEVARDIG